MANYTVKSGESWASIAGKMYGNQRWMQALSEANRNVSLHPGTQIKIPQFDTGVSPLVSNEFVARSNIQQQEYNQYNQLNYGIPADQLPGMMDYYVPGVSGGPAGYSSTPPPSVAAALGLGSIGGETVGFNVLEQFLQGFREYSSFVVVQFLLLSGCT